MQFKWGICLDAIDILTGVFIMSKQRIWCCGMLWTAACPFWHRAHGNVSVYIFRVLLTPFLETHV